MLETVNAQTGLSVTTIRIGQLSGSENGYWSITDWVPILFASSVQLGCLPDARGVRVLCSEISALIKLN